MLILLITFFIYNNEKIEFDINKNKGYNPIITLNYKKMIFFNKKCIKKI